MDKKQFAELVRSMPDASDEEILAVARGEAPKGIVGRTMDRLTTPLTTLPSEIGKKVGDWVDQRSEADIAPLPGLLGALGLNTGHAKGFVAGAAEGLGDVVSSFTSPADIAATVAGVGGAKAGARGLLGISKAARNVEAASMVPFAATGAQSLGQGIEEGDLAAMGTGALQGAMSAVGMKTAGSHAFPPAKVRDAYMRSAGRELLDDAPVAKLDEQQSMQIADAYDAMPHAPEDPRVAAAYTALADETSEQFKFLRDQAGVRMEPWTSDGQPYANSAEMIEDVTKNNRLFYFPTEQGYGSAPTTAKLSDLVPDSEGRDPRAVARLVEMIRKSGRIDPLEVSKRDDGKFFLEDGTHRYLAAQQLGLDELPIEMIGGQAPQHPLLAQGKSGAPVNDEFRAVHDYFGHAVEGNQFGPLGEERAYRSHLRMFPEAAHGAMTTETRGQNSNVNFGAHLRNDAGVVPKKGEPGFVPPQDRPFAEQKAGLLPEQFVHRPGRPTDPAPAAGQSVEPRRMSEPEPLAGQGTAAPSASALQDTTPVGDNVFDRMFAGLSDEEFQAKLDGLRNTGDRMREQPGASDGVSQIFDGLDESQFQNKLDSITATGDRMREQSLARVQAAAPESVKQPGPRLAVDNQPLIDAQDELRTMQSMLARSTSPDQQARLQNGITQVQKEIASLKGSGGRGSTALAVAAPSAALAIPEDDESNWDEFARAGLMAAGGVGMAVNMKRGQVKQLDGIAKANGGSESKGLPAVRKHLLQEHNGDKKAAAEAYNRYLAVPTPKGPITGVDFSTRKPLVNGVLKTAEGRDPKGRKTIDVELTPFAKKRLDALFEHAKTLGADWTKDGAELAQLIPDAGQRRMFTRAFAALSPTTPLELNFLQTAVAYPMLRAGVSPQTVITHLTNTPGYGVGNPGSKQPNLKRAVKGEDLSGDKVLALDRGVFGMGESGVPLDIHFLRAMGAVEELRPPKRLYEGINRAITKYAQEKYGLGAFDFMAPIWGSMRLISTGDAGGGVAQISRKVGLEQPSMFTGDTMSRFGKEDFPGGVITPEHPAAQSNLDPQEMRSRIYDNAKEPGRGPDPRSLARKEGQRDLFKSKDAGDLNTRMPANFTPEKLNALKQSMDEGGGGATFDTKTGRSMAGSDQYAVALFPELSARVPKATDKDIAKYILKNRELLAQPGHHLGIWKDASTGEVWMDISVLIPEEATAKAIAQKTNQKAIGFLGKDGYRDVEIGGSGDAVANLPKAKDRLKRLLKEAQRGTARKTADGGEPVPFEQAPVASGDTGAVKSAKPTDMQSRLRPVREKWFQGSRIADYDGKPLKVYHGTTADFKKFSVENRDEAVNVDMDTGAGYFFAERPSDSAYFTQKQTDLMGSRSDDYEPGANIRPVHLSVKNPKVFETQAEFREALGQVPYNREGDGFALREMLQKEGYDGIVIENSQMEGKKSDTGRWFIAFKPNQIKSAVGW